MQLPPKDHIIQATVDAGKLTYLFFGGDNVGKSALACQFPDAFVIGCNVGNLEHITRRGIYAENWEQALECLRAIAKEPNYCTTLVIDEIGRFYRYCYHFCRKSLAMSETDKDDFDVWRTCRNLWEKTLQDIQKLPFGKIYTANSEDYDSKDRKGEVYWERMANVGRQGNEVLHGIPILRGYISVESSGERVMTIEGDNFLKAGNKFSDNFTYNGNKLKSFSLGYSPSEAYQNFVAAFNNELPGEVIERPRPRMVIKKSGV